MKIAKGLRVRMQTKLEIDGGDVLEESLVEYIHGGGSMLAGLEQEIEGLAAGDKKEGVIPAERAFGSSELQPVKQISKREFPEDAKFEVGQQFAAKGENGVDVILRVVEVSDDAVSVRFVHPLADKNIRFAVEVMSVTNPAPPPLPVGAVSLELDEA